MTPEILGPAILAGCALLSFIVGYYATPTRVRVVQHRFIPPELSRLASALGITEDIPTSDSYGRRIHDLFEERDRYAESLKAEIRCLGEALEEADAELAAHAEAEIVRRRNDLPNVWSTTFANVANQDVFLPANGWVTYNGLKQAVEDSHQRNWICFETDPHEGYRDVTYENTKTGKSWTLRTPADTPTGTLLAMRDLAGWERADEYWGYGGTDVYGVNSKTQDLYFYPTWPAANSSVLGTALGTVSGLAPGYYYAPVQA